MSEAALKARSTRQRRAAAGSGHDAMIRVLRLLLPLGIVVLIVLLSVAPLLGGRDISFVLSKDRVDMAHERMRVANATYRGEDEKGEPFRLQARSAVQQTSRVPIVRLAELTGTIAMPDGPTTLAAPAGRYNMDSQQLRADGAVKFRGADGYRLDTRDVIVDLKTRKVTSTTPVDGAMTLGTFRSDHLFADLTAKTVVLTGAVHLHITQARGKARP